MAEREASRFGERVLAPWSAGVSMVVIMLSVLSIPLAAASQLELSPEEVTAWILVLFGLGGLLALVLSVLYRQPLLVTGNVFIMIFVASLGTQLSWSELVGASLLAGGFVLLFGALGLTGRLALWLPAPIVYGLLAGAILPFFIDLFVALGEEPVPVGIILGTYLVGALLLGGRVPPILPAMVVGFAVGAVTGDVRVIPEGAAFSVPAVTIPVFSLDAMLAATPVMVVLITLQANVPSIAFLKGQGYTPPERVVTMVSGVGTLAGSLLGPIGISLSLPATAMVGGEASGDRDVRYWVASLVGLAALLVGIFAPFAAEFAGSVPQPLLDAVVGLAVIGVLANALRAATRGPLVLGPMFAFAVSLSGLSLFGLGPFFWALALGLVASFFLEGAGWKELRQDESAS